MAAPLLLHEDGIALLREGFELRELSAFYRCQHLTYP